MPIHYQVHINIYSYYYYKYNSKLVWGWLKKQGSRWGSELVILY